MIYAQKLGVRFNFANNQRLKESGFAIDGVTVNGYVNQDGITINVNSAKALNRVVGHEITHILEGTDLYDSLAMAITEYAKKKGEYESRMQQIRDLYEGKEGYTGEDAEAKLEAELVADLVGDYIFTDKQFVEKLFTENRNLFQRIYDEIKYLCKLVTAGSKEARLLEKSKKMFAEVVNEAKQEGVKNPTAEGGVKYSLLVKDKNGNTTAVNPYMTTKEQSKEYMVKSRKGELDQYSYFPVSAHTPATVIATLKNAGIEITDKPLAMQAKKARQSQLDGQHTEPDGTVIRHHAMSTEEIQETIDKLLDPFAVIHQTERKKTIYKDGEKIRVPAPDNFVFL